MGKVFLNKQFSNYLGENRAILDTVVSFTQDIQPSPTPSPSVTPTMTPTQSPTPTPTPSPTPLNLEPEYQAVLTQAQVLGYDSPGYTQRNKQNQLVRDLKTAGLWTKISQLYMFRVDTSDGTSPGFTFINWITPTVLASLQRTNTTFALPSFTNNVGWTFNQNNSIQLGQNISLGPSPITLTTSTGNTEGVYYQQFIGNSTSGNNYIWSTNNNEWNRALYNNTTLHSIWREKQLTASYDFTGLGFKCQTTNGLINTDVNRVFRNGGVSTTRSVASADTGIGGGSMFVNGVSGGRHSWTCGMWFNGANLSSSVDVPALEAIINSYMTS